MAKSIIVLLLVLGLGISGALIYYAVTNAASREVKFRFRDLFTAKSIDEQSQLQLLVEAIVIIGLGLVVVFFVLL